MPKWFAVSAASFLCVFPYQLRCESPLPVTVCALTANPTEYDGRLVTFRGQAEGAWFESSHLGDVACKGYAIEFTRGQENAVKKSLDELREAVIRANWMTTRTSLEVVLVTVIGRFSYHPTELNRYVVSALTATDIVLRKGRTMMREPPPPPSSHPDIVR
jgi:hypothetical protein